MSDESRILLQRLDTKWHRTTRRRNRRILKTVLAGHIPTWSSDRGTPFSLPVFVQEPDTLVDELKRQRIFATRLWPDAEHDPGLHPAAAYVVKYMVSLPLDQRHTESDMLQIGAAALRAASPAPSPKLALRRRIRL